MGTNAHIIVTGRSRSVDVAALVEKGRCCVLHLEQQWSRFVDTSEICRLNEMAGTPVCVSYETLVLVRRGVLGWHLTGGHFDPTVLAALCALGYSRDLSAVQAEPPPALGRLASAAGCASIVIDESQSSVRLPAGVGFDPGGIGKGLAADMVVHALLAAGADGACVEIGGDVRVAGEGPEKRGWVIMIEDPRAPRPPLAEVWLAAGAVASSSPLHRSWNVAERSVHHLVDPMTGMPTQPGVAGVSVVAGEAWLAEVLATASCVDGCGDSIADVGASGVVVPMHGTPRRIGAFGDFAA